MRTVPLLIAALSLSLCACKGKKPEKSAETTAAEPAVGKEDADAPPEPIEAAEAGDDQINKMANCPSAVEGSTTVVENVDGGVVVKVTGGDEAEIRKRAALLSGLSAPAGGDIQHTGKGTGGGSLGKCPVVMREVQLSVEDIEGGAAITVKPKSGAAADVQELQRVSAARAAAMAAEGGGAAAADDGAERAAPRRKRGAPTSAPPGKGTNPFGGEDKMDATEEEDDLGM